MVKKGVDMKKDKNKIQIGDVLYEISKMYGTIIEWKIIDIFLEEYISGPATVIKVESPIYGKQNRFVSSLRHGWYGTREEADKAFDEFLDK